MAQPFRLVVLVSGNGSNLQAFIDRVADGSLPAVTTAAMPPARPLTGRWQNASTSTARMP